MYNLCYSAVYHTLSTNAKMLRHILILILMLSQNLYPSYQVSCIMVFTMQHALPVHFCFHAPQQTTDGYIVY